MNKRELSAQQTREKLIQTALKLFRTNGFDDINVEQITQTAGLSKGTFYTYFKRKEDIVIEICRDPFNHLLTDIETTNEDILAKLTHYFKQFMVCIEIYDIHICRSWIRDVIDPNKATKDWDNQKWLYDTDMLRHILKTAVAKKELKASTPIELLVHLIISQLYGMMTCWCMSDGLFQPLEWTDKFCNFQIKPLLQPYLTNKKGENK